MFTGLISHLGNVKSIELNGDSAKLNIQSPEIASEIKIGDSVAVNGVCLTVTEFDTQGFSGCCLYFSLSSCHSLVFSETDPRGWFVIFSCQEIEYAS